MKRVKNWKVEREGRAGEVEANSGGMAQRKKKKNEDPEVTGHTSHRV